MAKNGSNIAQWINGALITILIALIGFIYNDYIKRDEAFNKELISAIKENTISLAAIKKYILITDKIDIDEVVNQSKWEDLMKSHESKPRGIFVPPENLYADRLIKK